MRDRYTHKIGLFLYEEAPYIFLFLQWNRVLGIKYSTYNKVLHDMGGIKQFGFDNLQIIYYSSWTISLAATKSKQWLKLSMQTRTKMNAAERCIIILLFIQHPRVFQKS